MYCQINMTLRHSLKKLLSESNLLLPRTEFTDVKYSKIDKSRIFIIMTNNLK